MPLGNDGTFRHKLKIYLPTIALICALLIFPILHNNDVTIYDYASTGGHGRSSEICRKTRGVEFYSAEKEEKTSNTCFGRFRSTKSRIQYQYYAIQAPRIKKVCLDNPFHAFYDCIWPFAQFITSCLPKDVTSYHIISDLSSLSATDKRSWFAEAMSTFMNGINRKNYIIQENDYEDKTGICFRNVTKFKRKTVWRPLQFNVMFENIDVQYSEIMRAQGIKLFRSVMLKQLNLKKHPVDGHKETTKILVYDRSDAPRRRWENAEEFYQLLLRKYGTTAGIEIKFIRAMNGTLHDQAKLFNDATVHIASHGAALANSLFMRPNSGLLEIASIRCENPYYIGSEKKNLDTITERSTWMGWTSWHSSVIGIHHMLAPCVRTKKERQLLKLHDSNTQEIDHTVDPHILLELTDHLLMTQRTFRKVSI